MKNIAIILGFFSLIFAQTTVSGVVTDGDNNPVADANIVLSNGFGTTSDNDGSFAFTATVPTTATTVPVTIQRPVIYTEEDNLRLTVYHDKVMLIL